MNNIFLEKLYVMFLGAASRTNYYAEEKDINRNHTNYGSATAYANVLRDLGNNVEVCCWEDNGYLKIEKVFYNDREIKF